MLGTLADADDVAQDTWLRWQAVGGARMAKAEAWLVTAATRLCLDRLRSAADRELVSGLLRALASGDMSEVVARLAPEVVCITDGGPERRAARRPVAGSGRVARFLVAMAWPSE